MLILRRTFRVMMTLVIAVAFGGLLPFGAADVAASTGYGSIAGNSLEQSTGNPLYPATIRVENYDTGDLVGEFSNYADGSFYIVIADGTYRVAAYAPGHIIGWYPDTGSKGDATPIAVAVDGAVTDINFNLEQGGSISGTVFNQWSGTEQNQVVIAWTADALEMVAWTFSDDWDDGQYTIIDVPFGNYKVSAGGPLPEGVEDFNQAIIRRS